MSDYDDDEYEDFEIPTYEDLIAELVLDVDKANAIYAKVEDNFSKFLDRIMVEEPTNERDDRKRRGAPTSGIATRDLTFLGNQTAALAQLKGMKFTAVKDIISIKKQQFAEEMRIKEFEFRQGAGEGEGGISAATLEEYTKNVLTSLGLQGRLPSPSVPEIDLNEDLDVDALLLARLGNDTHEDDAVVEEELVENLTAAEFELVAVVSEDEIDLRLRNMDTGALTDAPDGINEDLVSEDEDGNILYDDMQLPQIPV